MRVLFYTPVKLLHGGGGERWHCDIANSLEKQFGLEIEIISGNLGNNVWSKKFLHQQLKDISYAQLNYINFLGILIPTPYIFFFLLKKIKSADIVYFAYGFVGQDILMALIGLLTSKKIITVHHAPIFHSGKFHNLYMKFISRYIMNFFYAHHTLNTSDSDFFEKKWKIKNVFFIPNGICLESFLRIKRGRHNKLIFVSVGRYEIQKGYDLLLKAIEKFNQQIPNNKAKFYFVGEGSLKYLISRYSKKHKNIIDLGYINYKKLPEIYTKSDVFLSSSRKEPFGLALVEAWSSGLPVLSTKTEGPTDMLKPKINGWFIEEITVNSIYKNITKLYQKYLSNKNYFSQFEKECRKTGMLYSVNSAAKNIKKVFLRLT